jgi:membrane associated rhomboid family serine protease
MLLFLPFPIKAKYLIGFYMIFEIYASLGYAGMSNVAHLAHLGGALIGFLLIKYWRVRRQY